MPKNSEPSHDEIDNSNKQTRLQTNKNPFSVNNDNIY